MSEALLIYQGASLIIDQGTTLPTDHWQGPDTTGSMRGGLPPPLIRQTEVTGMNKRLPVRKSLRFDIFQRDSFTCRFCGAQPPEVILHIDHLVPVIDGGANDPENLVTACQDCNLGKGRKSLLTEPPFPDTDLKLLKIHQQTLEYEQFIEASVRLDQARRRICAHLYDVWEQTYGKINVNNVAPPDSALVAWVEAYDPSIVERGIRAGYPAWRSNKIDNGSGFKLGKMIAYLTAIMRNLSEAQDA
jgi:hypothetical protein